MTVKILNCGALIHLDDQDADLLEGRSWHVYRLRNRWRQGVSTPMVARTEQCNGRMFRIYMHREIAIRKDPGLIRQSFRVYPVNGDYLDCRRENLHVVLRKPRTGRKKVEPRPKGWKRHEVTGKQPNHSGSQLWAGGFEFRPINQWKKGGRYRIRKCLAGKPID